MCAEGHKLNLLVACCHNKFYTVFACNEFAKAKNTVEIFEGAVEVIFYDSSTKEYRSSGLSFDATEYTLKQLKIILGDENVVLK